MRVPPQGADQLFCGADKEAGEIYCPFHQRLARVQA
jgi:hypothetical protein